MNLEQSETLALNLEQATQDKVALQKRLQTSLEKEGKPYKGKKHTFFMLFCVFYCFSFNF